MNASQRQLVETATLVGIGWLLWFALSEQRAPLPDGRFIERAEDATVYWAFIALTASVFVMSASRFLKKLLPPEQSG